MSSGSNGRAGWFKWLVGTLIALLAAGSGIVALLNYCNRPLVEIPEGPQPTPVVCSISGAVYNRDDNQPIANAVIGYVAGADYPVLVHSGPDGRFEADCSQVDAGYFPLRLVVMGVIPGCGVSFQSDVYVGLGEKRSDINIYVSRSSLEAACP